VKSNEGIGRLGVVIDGERSIGVVGIEKTSVDSFLKSRLMYLT